MPMSIPPSGIETNLYPKCKSKF